MKRDRTPATQHPGLVNPEVIPHKATSEPSIDTGPSLFRTHIAEPRWQIVASIVFVILAAIIWWSLILHWL